MAATINTGNFMIELKLKENRLTIKGKVFSFSTPEEAMSELQLAVTRLENLRELRASIVTALINGCDKAAEMLKRNVSRLSEHFLAKFGIIV